MSTDPIIRQSRALTRSMRVLVVAGLAAAATVSLALFPSAVGSVAHAQPPGCNNSGGVNNDIPQDTSLFARDNRCFTTGTGRVWLVFQQDGNLVAYRQPRPGQPRRVCFASNTVGIGYRLIIWPRSRLTIHNDQGAIARIFGTGNRLGGFLSVQRDGAVVLYGRESNGSATPVQVFCPPGS